MVGRLARDTNHMVTLNSRLTCRTGYLLHSRNIWPVQASSKSNKNHNEGTDLSLPSPKRVDKSSPVKVRDQLQHAKRRKEEQEDLARAPTPVRKTAYRKPKPTLEERAAEKTAQIEEWRNRNKVDTAAAISYTTGWQFPAGPPVLLVDGYNMVGAWEELKHLESFSDARKALERMLTYLLLEDRYKGSTIFVVYDAMLSGDMRLKTFKLSPRLYQVFTGDCSADMHLERMAESCSSAGHSSITVYTNDKGIMGNIMERGLDRVYHADAGLLRQQCLAAKVVVERQLEARVRMQAAAALQEKKFALSLLRMLKVKSALDAQFLDSSVVEPLLPSGMTYAAFEKLMEKYSYLRLDI